jgi:hypothetical protein
MNQMGIKILSFSALVLLPSLVHSKIVPIIDENYEDCMKGGSVGVLDLTQLKFVRQNENYFVNGENLKLLTYQQNF